MVYNVSGNACKFFLRLEPEWGVSMIYAKVRLEFQRFVENENKILGFPGNKILIRVWIDSSLWRWRIVPEEDDFASLLAAVAEIDRDLDAQCDYSEGPFLPEIIRQLESIRRGVEKILAEKAS